MPITVQRHLCKVCGDEYDDYSHAVTCESAPVEPMEFKVGDKITFMNEHSGMGVRWSYTTNEGTVLLSYVVSVHDQSTGQPTHQRVYVVDGPYCELLVVRNPEGGWCSPAEGKYQQGYAENTMAYYNAVGLQYNQ